MSVRIALTNQKGGAGKTTSSIELAACFSAMKYKVLLIDMDQQVNATQYSGGNLDKGLFDLLTDKNESVENVIQHLDEYDLIASSGSLSKIDTILDDDDAFFALDDILNKDKINKYYDFIIIDTFRRRKY